MQYMMLIYLDENSITEKQRAQCYTESAAYAKQLHAEGKCLAVAPLQPTLTATSIRHGEGKQVITDGLFAETREQLGGFFLINAALMPQTSTKPSTLQEKFTPGAGAPSKSAPSWRLAACIRKS
jgi:hypothetical protein